MRTAAEALTACLARGIRQPECEEIVGSQLVDGVYCDGTIVLDSRGRRCVSREFEARVDDLRDADPLPAPMPEETYDPLKTWMTKVALVGGAAVVLVGIWWWSRKA